MTFLHQENNRHTITGRPVNYEAREHIYTDGYGFSPHRPDVWELRAVFEMARTVGLCLLAFFLLGMFAPQFLYSGLQMLFSRLGIALHPELTAQLSSGLAMAISILVPFWFVGSSGYGFFAAHYNTVRPGFGLILAACLITLGVSVVGIYSSAMLQSGFEAFGIMFGMVGYSPPAFFAAKLMYWANLVLIPAVCEELAFRKFLLGSLRRFGDGFALLVSSMVFALIHILPIRWPFALLMGLAIGYFVLLTGSVWTGILLHALNNALTLAAMIAETQGKASLLPAVQAVYLLLAMGALLWLVRFRSGLFVLRKAESHNDEGTKLRVFWSSLPMVLVVLAVLVMAADRVITL